MTRHVVYKCNECDYMQYARSADLGIPMGWVEFFTTDGHKHYCSEYCMFNRRGQNE